MTTRDVDRSRQVLADLNEDGDTDELDENVMIRWWNE